MKDSSFFKTKTITIIWSYISNLNAGALTNDLRQHRKNTQWIYDWIPLVLYFEKAIKAGTPLIN